MYISVWTDIRLTDKFFDPKVIENLKTEIKNDVYFKNNENVDNISTMSELFELFGIYISNINMDEYLWATFRANIFNIKNIEKLFTVV